MKIAFFAFAAILFAQNSFAISVQAKFRLTRYQESYTKAVESEFGRLKSTIPQVGAQGERNLLNAVKPLGEKLGQKLGAQSPEEIIQINKSLIEGPESRALLSKVVATKLLVEKNIETRQEAAVVAESAKVLLQTLSLKLESKVGLSQLKSDEALVAEQALARIDKLMPDILAFQPAEREAYVQLLKQQNEIILTQKVSGKDALLQAVQIKRTGNDRQKALEFLKKLNDCY